MQVHAAEGVAHRLEGVAGRLHLVGGQGHGEGQQQQQQQAAAPAMGDATNPAVPEGTAEQRTGRRRRAPGMAEQLSDVTTADLLQAAQSLEAWSAAMHAAHAALTNM